MKYRIEDIQSRKLVGKHLDMTFSEDKTRELWMSFMPERNKVQKRTDSNYYSMQIYCDVFDFSRVNPDVVFTKWAAVEVNTEVSHENAESSYVPKGMNEYTLKGGTYAVFNHVGPASSIMKSLHFVHNIWLPASGYVIDDREHFEILPENYNPMDENATEEIWIPVIQKEN